MLCKVGTKAECELEFLGTAAEWGVLRNSLWHPLRAFVMSYLGLENFKIAAVIAWNRILSAHLIGIVDAEEFDRFI